MSQARWSRLREVGAAGIARRLRHRIEEPARRRSRAAWSARFGAVGAGAGDDLLATGAPLAEVLRDRGPFWRGSSQLAAAFPIRHREGRDRILAQAESTLAGDVSWVAPCASPSWHRALPGGASWPSAPAEEIAIGAAAPLGDVRLAWELHRCSHVLRLAQAFALTGDERFGRGVVDRLHDYRAENPPGIGIGWAHAQEVALRALARLWSLRLAGRASAFDEGAWEAGALLLVSHAEFVAAHLSDHPVTHNHLISESAALAQLGLALPALRGADRWRELGLRVLFREIRKQVDESGVDAEHSSHYHAFVLDSCLTTLLLCARAGRAVPAQVRARVEAMCDYLALLLRHDGTLPPVGDSDAGRGVRLGTDPLDRRDLLAAAAVHFSRSDWGAIAGDAPGAFWTTDGAPVPGAGAPAPRGRARRHEAAGIAVARTGFGPDEEVFVFRAGPTRFRPDVLRSHMHADALSVLLRVEGEDVLVDPGTYLYSEGLGWRAALRRTRAHSCPTLGGRDQADVSSQRFGILGESTAQWLSFEGDATRCAAGAAHPGGASPALQRRAVWLCGGLLSLCDERRAGTGLLEAWLQLPESEGSVDASGALLRLASGRRVRVQGSGGPQRIEVLRPVAGEPGPAWRAPRYGQLAKGTTLRIAAPEDDPDRLLVLVQVETAAGVPSPGSFELSDAGAVALCARGRVAFPVRGGGGVTVAPPSEVA